MQRPIRQKQPGETRTLGFDFTNKLAPGDALAGSPGATVSPSGALSVSALSRVSETVVNARLAGGADGSDYVVSVTCSTVDGDLLELDAVIEVRDGSN